MPTKEKILALLKEKKKTVSEIARECGVSVQWVSKVAKDNNIEIVRKPYYRNAKEVVCKYCKKKVYISQSRFAHTKYLQEGFCSAECKMRYTYFKEYTCAVCGKKFIRDKRIVERNKKYYNIKNVCCSHECALKLARDKKEIKNQ